MLDIKKINLVNYLDHKIFPMGAIIIYRYTINMKIYKLQNFDRLIHYPYHFINTFN